MYGYPPKTLRKVPPLYGSGDRRRGRRTSSRPEGPARLPGLLNATTKSPSRDGPRGVMCRSGGRQNRTSSPTRERRRAQRNNDSRGLVCMVISVDGERPLDPRGQLFQGLKLPSARAQAAEVCRFPGAERGITTARVARRGNGVDEHNNCSGLFYESSPSTANVLETREASSSSGVASCYNQASEPRRPRGVVSRGAEGGSSQPHE